MILLEMLDKVLLICMGAAILLGALMFFVAGIYRVKKGSAIIIEKAGEYYKTCEQGWYFFMPIAYQRKATYSIEPRAQIVMMKNHAKVEIFYRISDAKTYYYSQSDVPQHLNKIRDEYKELNMDILKEEFQKIGIEFLNIKKPK